MVDFVLNLRSKCDLHLLKRALLLAECQSTGTIGAEQNAALHTKHSIMGVKGTLAGA